MDIFIDAEFKKAIPPLAAEELKALEDSIVAEGCRDALVVWKEKQAIVDGHNRYDICTRNNIPYRIFEKSFADRDEALDWIDANQLARRNLSPDQMSLLRGRRYNRVKGRQGGDHKSNGQNDLLINRAETLATQYGVSEKTIRRDAEFADTVGELQTTIPDIEERVLLGRLTKTDVATLGNLKPEQQARVLTFVDQGDAKNIITARKLLMREEVAKIEPPKGKYQVLYADPPWEYDFGFDIHGAALRHYNTMSIAELCALPIKDIADDNAVFFLWVTSPKLADCWPVITAWGFEYKTSFVWDKVKHVMGHYNSVRHEFLLICTRGSYPKQSNTLADSVVTIERTDEHSEKPKEFRKLIEEMYPQSTKIELFARESVPGWYRWPEDEVNSTD
jgi:N6-adenosine-specific RNA methylase IME4